MEGFQKRSVEDYLNPGFPPPLVKGEFAPSQGIPSVKLKEKC